MSIRDIICRDLHATQPSDIQAFIDSLSIVERHRVMRILNSMTKFTLRITAIDHKFAIRWLISLTKNWEFSTGPAGRKD